MHFEPSPQEYAALQAMSGRALMEYFIIRVAEVEEVWGLGDETGWVMRELEGQTTLPVWPYQQLASQCAVRDWNDQKCKSVSLEHFMSHILMLLIDKDIQIEIMPAENSEGFIMDPQQLSTLFESLLETGEYYLEG
jgi:hypothetical protein